jgi:hypothetical protein
MYAANAVLILAHVMMILHLRTLQTGIVPDCAIRSAVKVQQVVLVLSVESLLSVMSATRSFCVGCRKSVACAGECEKYLFAALKCQTASTAVQAKRIRIVASPESLVGRIDLLCCS